MDEKFQTQLNLPPMVRTSGSSGIFKPRSQKNIIEPSFHVMCNNEKNSYEISQDKDLFSIGKGEDCDIIVKDQSVEDEHIVVAKIGEYCYFMDRGAKDMITFNGVKCRQASIPIKSRMIIKIGTTVIVYVGMHSDDFSDDPNPTIKTSLDTQHEIDLNPEGELLLKSNSGERYTDSIPILVGNHNACDYQLTGTGIEPFHYYIYFTPKGAFVEDLTHARPGIKINELKSLGSYPIKEDLTISIGNFAMYIYIYGNLESRCKKLFKDFNEAPNLVLTPLKEGADVTILPKTHEKISLGRNSECEIEIDHPSISREHAHLQVKDKYFYFTDNGSSNGSFHNLDKVEKAKVFPGDIVEFGSISFLVHYQI